MSIFTSETRVTHRYLMNKSKYDLSGMIMNLLDQLDEANIRSAEYAELVRHAERYRWFREANYGLHGGLEVAALHGAETLDAAIDAAIDKEPK